MEKEPPHMAEQIKDKKQMIKNKKEKLEQKIEKVFIICPVRHLTPLERKVEKVFIICPVRNLTPAEDAEIQAHIGMLESKGIKVHYPPRDTNQNDPIGLNICSTSRAAIKNSDEIHNYFNPLSEGSAFDSGMTFMVGKPIFIINADTLKSYASDDFARFLLKYAYNTRIDQPSYFYEKMLKKRVSIKKAKSIIYDWKGNTCDFLFDFGMAFASEKPIYLLNREELKPTDGKSFINVLLALDEFYRKKYNNSF